MIYLFYIVKNKECIERLGGNENGGGGSGSGFNYSTSVASGLGGGGGGGGGVGINQRNTILTNSAGNRMTVVKSENEIYDSNNYKELFYQSEAIYYIVHHLFQLKLSKRHTNPNHSSKNEEEEEEKNELNEFTSGNEETMIKLLSVLFLPLIKANLLFQFIKTLSKTQLNARKLQKLMEYICSFKIRCFTSREFQLKQIERTITINKSKYNVSIQNFIQLPKNSTQKLFISRALTVLAIGSELVHFFLLKRKILKEKIVLLENHVEILSESGEVKSIVTNLMNDKLNLQQMISDLKVESEKGFSYEYYLPSAIIQSETTHANSILQLKQRKNQLTEKLIRIREQIQYSENLIETLHRKKDQLSLSNEKQLHQFDKLLENELKLKLNSTEFSISTFKSFFSEEHPKIMQKLKSDSDNILNHLNSLEPNLLKFISEYIDLQIYLLEFIKDNFKSSSNDNDKLYYLDCLNESETTAHSLAEILTLLTQHHSTTSINGISISFSSSSFLLSSFTSPFSLFPFILLPFPFPFPSHSVSFYYFY